MKGQRVLLAIGSIALSAILLLILARVGSVDARSTLGLLMNVSFSSFARLLLLNTFLVYFSSEKWRSIDVASRRRTDSVPSRMNAMAFTALGFALGLVLPIQIAMATARTLGIYGHDKPIKRGIAWTLFEQVFDIGLVFFLGAASLATYLFHGGPKLWIALAFSSVAIAFLSVSPCIRLASCFFLLPAMVSLSL